MADPIITQAVAEKDVRIAELEAENARLRAFIQSIDDEWVSSEPASEDEWSDGHEDCLSEWAKKARQELEGRNDA